MLVHAVCSACKDIAGTVYEQHRGPQNLEAAVCQGEKPLTVPLLVPEIIEFRSFTYRKNKERAGCVNITGVSISVSPKTCKSLEKVPLLSCTILK